jgi:hypothetical protein
LVSTTVPGQSWNILDSNSINQSRLGSLCSFLFTLISGRK